MPEIVRKARRGGLDLSALGSRAGYDAQVEPGHRLRGDEDWGVVLVLGNTKEIWNPFVAWLADDDARVAAPHPLDAYVAEVVRAAVGPGSRAEVHGLHDRARPVLSARKLAAVCGLASAGPAGLSAHDRFGPWIALRAAVVLPGPTPRGEEARAPCADCEGPCATALTNVLSEQGRDPGEPDHTDVARRWRSWVSVRDACPVGRSWRYDTHALAYHYTKDRSQLRALVDAHRERTSDE